MLIDKHKFKGFLHDFDYSIYFQDDHADANEDIEKSLKDMTVS
jgi:hypothetical protein